MCVSCFEKIGRASRSFFFNIATVGVRHRETSFFETLENKMILKGCGQHSNQMVDE